VPPGPRVHVNVATGGCVLKLLTHSILEISTSEMSTLEITTLEMLSLEII
jgi:hypothetical protein